MPRQEDRERFEAIPDDEPVFIVQGRDLLALGTVTDWLNRATEAGVATVKIQRAERAAADIEQFQAECPERCKIPD